MTLQKLGGYAAIAGLFVYMVVVALVVRIRPLGDWSDPAKMIVALSAARSTFYLDVLLWMAGYILSLIMFFALHERMQADAPHLSRIMVIAASASTAMAIAETVINLKCATMIISQQDLSAFRACWAVTQGLHWAEGHACAWAFLFFGCAALKTRAFSRILGRLFLLTGILWIPQFFLIQIEFSLLWPVTGLLGGVAIVWIGIALLRQKQPQYASTEMAASR